MVKHYAIYVYGDSLSLPRTRDGVRYYDTYAELLRNEVEHYDASCRVTVLNRSQGGGYASALFSSFVNDSAYFGRDGAAILLIQCGIVDCAPRPVPMSMRKIIGRLPVPLRWIVSKGLHHARPYLLRSGMSWRQSTPDEFNAQLRTWLEKAAPQFDQIYVLNIAPTVESIERHSPGLGQSIAVFNDVIAQTVEMAGHSNVRLIDIHSAVSKSPQGVSRLIDESDGHHITRAGHRLYADEIWAHERIRMETAVTRVAYPRPRASST